MTLLSRTLSTLTVFLALVAPGAQAADQDIKAMMMKDHEKMMSMQATGRPDVDFALMMREHHLGAVQMAEWQLAHGKDRTMKAMARKIIADQKKEIAQFDRFLAQNGQQPSGAAGAGSGKSHSPSHGHAQPR